jgi:hypothetical protein
MQRQHNPKIWPVIRFSGGVVWGRIAGWPDSQRRFLSLNRKVQKHNMLKAELAASKVSLLL